MPESENLKHLKLPTFTTVEGERKAKQTRNEFHRVDGE
jgi:hypothetical protein